MSSENQYKVIIIGAGVSGISAAKALVDNNITNILLLEAQNYVGGRIKTEQHEGGVIEYGAQWLHGTENEIKQISDENNLLSTKTSKEGAGVFVREDGFVFNESQVSKIEMIVGEILSRCEKISPEDAHMSVGAFLDREFNKYLSELEEDSMDLWKQLFRWHVKFQTVDNSCMSLDDLSAAHWGDYDFNGDESQSHINFSNGYLSLLECIIGKIPDLKILKNKPVKKVIWEDEKNDGTVEIICEDDTVYHAEHVICTVSLGVLKADHEKLFSPRLPDSLVLAINTMGFGTIAKMFLQFEDSWWENSQGFQIVRRAEEEQEYAWYHDISGFDVVDVGLPHCLMGWVSSKGAILMESLTDFEVANRCLSILENCTQMKVPHLKMFKRSKWLSNQYVKGSYSHITQECHQLKITPSSLQEPVVSCGKPVLMFAGEACHDTHFSTTHGAFEAGKMQAERIAKFQIN